MLLKTSAQSQFQHRKHSKLHEPAEPVFVRGNGPVITAAVSNLIENALNHSPLVVGRTDPGNVDSFDRGSRLPGLAFRRKKREKVLKDFGGVENSRKAQD